jgi:type VI secretion system VasD/TssJ family lipoprotein
MRLLCVFVLLTTLAGCSGRTAQIRGVIPLNLNSEGESTPVDLRIYPLRTDNAFARAGFAALWTEPSQTLGDELIGSPITLTVLPGSSGDAPHIVDLGSQAGQAAWIGVQLLVRREDDLPRTLLLPAGRLPEVVIEAVGYGLRLGTRR